MRVYYATKKRVNKFIETKLKQYDSLESFREDLRRVISECDESMKNQKHFFSRVLTQLGE